MTLEEHQYDPARISPLPSNIDIAWLGRGNVSRRVFLAHNGPSKSHNFHMPSFVKKLASFFVSSGNSFDVSFFFHDHSMAKANANALVRGKKVSEFH